MSPFVADLAAEAAAPTRDRLIRAALRLFQERGYHGVGTAEILTAARAPRGSLYHHFGGGKAELAAAAADRIAEAVAGEIARLGAETRDPGKVVGQIGAQCANWLEGTGFRQSGLLAGLAVGGGGDRALAAAVAAAYSRIERALAEVMVPTAGKRAEALARHAVASLEGAFILARVHGDAGVLRSEADRLARELRRECDS